MIDLVAAVRDIHCNSAQFCITALLLSSIEQA